MNERIQELAREAGFYANSDIEKFEKFAELIIRQCAKLADKESCYPYSTYGLLIKEQFGVKE
jgi:hypothetical protein